MAVTIACLRVHPKKSGHILHYWEPSKTLRDAGWQQVALGRDAGAAYAAAIEINKQVAAWKAGGKAPDGVRKRAPADTLASLIDRYERERFKGHQADGKPWLKPATIGQYRPNLARLRAWAGTKPLAWVTPGQVGKLRDKYIKEGMSHHAIHDTLIMGRTLFAFAEAVDITPRGSNPFLNFGLAAPAPRDIIWSPLAREALAVAGAALDLRSVTLAMQLGFATGQRPQDFRAMGHGQFKPIPAHMIQPEDYATLAAASPDGVPHGLHVGQLKTGAIVFVPIVGAVRAAMEANIAAARARGATTILIDEARGGNYADKAGKARFNRDFAAIRDHAVATAKADGLDELAEEIAGLEHRDRLQFRDLRRTCVVYLGELGLSAATIAAITGHNIAKTTAILKVYMPRTTGRAAHAVAFAFGREANLPQGKGGNYA